MANKLVLCSATLLLSLAAGAGDGSGSDSWQHPESALGMYVAPENRLIFKLRNPDGSTREFERVYEVPGMLRSLNGWYGEFRGNKVHIRSGKNAKGGVMDYWFDCGRLVGLKPENGEPVRFDYSASRPLLPECESPILRALAPVSESVKKKIDREYEGKWLKSRRLQFPYANPNRNAMLCSELALLLFAGVLYFRRRILKVVCACAMLVPLVGLAWSGSRGAMLGFAAATIVFGCSRLAAIRGMLRRKSTWVIVGAVTVALAGWLCFNNTHFLTRGFGSGNKGWSNKIRLEIMHNAPMMIADAPGGWGVTDFNVGHEYLNWYQPLDVVALTGSLICDHLTRLAGFGHLGRFFYLFGWFIVLGLSFRLLVRKRDPFPLAVWLALGITATFNPLLSVFVMWIVPMLSLIPLFRSRPWADRKWFWMISSASLVLAAMVLLTIYWIGSTMKRVDAPIRRDGKCTLIKSVKPVNWIVNDGLTLGGVLGWKDVREYYRRNPKAAGVGCVSSVTDLPTEGVRHLLLAGSAGDEWLKRISSNAELRRHLPETVVFLSPPFPPSAIPPPLFQACKVRLVIGEFMTWYHSADYAQAPDWVTIVPGMEMYIANWMDFATR